MATPMRFPRTHLDTILDRCRTGFLAAFVASFGVNLLVLTGSVYMLQVYDRVLTSRSTSTLIWLTLIAVVALLVMAALDVVRSRILVRIGSWIDRILSALVFARSVDARQRRADAGAESLRDVAVLRNFLGGGASVSLMDAPWTPVYLAFIYMLHPWLGHVALLGALVLFGLAFLSHAATKSLMHEAALRSAESYRAAGAAIRHADVVSGMGMVGVLARRWDAANAKVLHLQARASERNGLLASAAKFFRMALQIAVLGVGAALVIADQVGAGAMVAASIIMGRALAPVEQAIGVWKQVTGAREAWARLQRLFHETNSRDGAMSLPRPNGNLVVENVAYRPQGAREPTLAAVTFALEPGEALAVVGPSGAGKSTLARLVLGMAEPVAGCVRLDGADMSKAGQGGFGRYIGYLPQDVQLFPGTVRENIARMDAEADPAGVIEAARLAGVHEMILRLPQGYDTAIGESGAPLSGGQMQRVGLARAVYGRPALVVLDEPNASLDTEGESALHDAIARMKAAGTTIVVIAHRPSLMPHVDKILVLNGGRMQMFGDRQSVLAKIQPPEQPKRVRIVS